MPRSASDEVQRSDALDNMELTDVMEKLKKILGIMEKEDLKTNITRAAVEEIKEYLKALDLVEYEEVETAIASDEESISRVIFTQPGMRYCQAEALVYSLMRSGEFKALSEKDKMLIAHKILDDLRGIMLEDIVLLETAKTLPKTKKAFKLQFDVGEFDMVIYDSDRNTCEVFEVKHSSQKNPKQIRFLLREDVCAATEKKYGKITAKYVLYNGVTEATADGITYKNIAEYLKSL